MVGSVTVISGASSIPADGTSTTVIRATVKDIDGNLAPGIDVFFATTLGTVNGSASYTVTTDGNGIAQVTLRSTTTSGTATVTANASGFIDSVDVEFEAGAPGGLVLTATALAVSPGGTSILTVTLTDSGGSPIAGETIAFVIAPNNSNSSLSAPSAVTDINGQATITYTAGTTEPVTDTIHAASITDNSLVDTVDINVNADAIVVGGVTVISGASSLPADGTSTTIVRATVKDINGNLAPGI
ncbi:MAG: hypothetical protein DRH37_09235, partial [Deltaproteobacteria bacterium]